MSARVKTLNGEMVTVTETLGSNVNKRHWFTVSGTDQGVIDYLNEQGIPEHKVKGMTVVSSIYYVLFHK